MRQDFSFRISRKNRKSNFKGVNKSGQKLGALVAAFLANVGIAISKFIAFIVTGSASMLAEAIHSMADSSNQVLLYFGGREAKKSPTKEHPFGFGRAHFLYAFLVSIILFSLGGAFAIYEGIHKIIRPEMIESPVIAYVVLGIAVLLEGFALKTALHEARSFKPESQDWWQFLRRTKSVNHIVLALEDSTALIGLSVAAIGITLTLTTGNPVWDGVASLVIGLLLATVALVLYREIRSLLIGESVSPRIGREMREIILGVEGVDKILDLKTIYTGPTEMLVTMEIEVSKNKTAKSIDSMVHEIEYGIRSTFSAAKLIYIEPHTPEK